MILLIIITLFLSFFFFYQNLINLWPHLLIMKIFSQYSIIMSYKKMLEDSPMQNPLRFLKKNA